MHLSFLFLSLCLSVSLFPSLSLSPLSLSLLTIKKLYLLLFWYYYVYYIVHMQCNTHFLHDTLFMPFITLLHYFVCIKCLCIKRIITFNNIMNYYKAHGLYIVHGKFGQIWKLILSPKRHKPCPSKLVHMHNYLLKFFEPIPIN